MEYFNAFWVGGLICAIGQILMDKTALTPARILVAFVCAGVVLTAMGIYDPLADYAGTGATIPISGFGYSLAKGVERAVDKDGFLGIISGGLTASAPGITAAIIFGFIFALLGKPKEK